MFKILNFSLIVFNLLFSCMLIAQIMPYQYGFSNTLSKNNIGDPIILLDGAYASQSKWFDTGGFGNDFSLEGSPSINTSYKGIVQFDGVDDYGELETLDVNFSLGITILAFVKFDSIVDGDNRNFERILDFGEGQDNYNIFLSRQSEENNLIFAVRQGEGTGGFFSMLSGGILNGQWGFYGARVDGTNYTLFNQNDFITEQSGIVPPSHTRNSNFIGDSNWSTDGFFKGDMGVIAVYNRKLTDSQINSFYYYYRGRYGLPKKNVLE